MFSITAPSSSANILQFERPDRFYRLRSSFMESHLQSLPALVQALYIHIALRHNGKNNGRILFSIRDGVAALHAGKNAVARGLKQLEAERLIVCTKRGRFDRKTSDAKATEWLLPEFGPAQTDNYQFSPGVPAGTCSENRPPASTLTTGTPLDKEVREVVDEILRKRDLQIL
jgi:hypothetical protein